MEDDDDKDDFHEGEYCISKYRVLVMNTDYADQIHGRAKLSDMKKKTDTDVN